jgi:hypothetical protein
MAPFRACKKINHEEKHFYDTFFGSCVTPCTARIFTIGKQTFEKREKSGLGTDV